MNELYVKYIGRNSFTLNVWVNPDKPAGEAGFVRPEGKTCISNARFGLKVNAVGHSGLQFGMKVTNGTIGGNSLNFNSSMPYIDTISFRLDSASSKLNLVWTDLLNLYDSLILCEFLFTPSVSSSSLDSFFIVDESLIPAYIVDSSGSPVDGNFVVSIIGEDTSVLRHSFDSIIDSVFKLNVYPNPSNEVIFISLEGNYESTCINKLATISIISSDGIVVKEDRILINESHEVHEMDVSVLSGGQWFVLVTMDSHTVVGSFIIIR